MVIFINFFEFATLSSNDVGCERAPFQLVLLLFHTLSQPLLLYFFPRLNQPLVTLLIVLCTHHFQRLLAQIWLEIVVLVHILHRFLKGFSVRYQL